jgi:hypothetical protein
MRFLTSGSCFSIFTVPEKLSSRHFQYFFSQNLFGDVVDFWFLISVNDNSDKPVAVVADSVGVVDTSTGVIDIGDDSFTTFCVMQSFLRDIAGIYDILQLKVSSTQLVCIFKETIKKVF